MENSPYKPANPQTATKTLTVSGTELAGIIAQHLADGWRVIGQTTLGASEFEIVLTRDKEDAP